MKGKDKSKGKKGKSKVGKDFKGNGKGKSDGKTKGKVKGKSKDGGKSYSGAGQGKGKTLPGDTCRVCGEKGHWGRECPKRAVRQVGGRRTKFSGPFFKLKLTGMSSFPSHGQGLPPIQS